MKSRTAFAACVLSLLPLFSFDAHAAAGKLVLEDFFNGSMTATGVFNNTRDGSKRGMKVAMRGVWDGKALTLREDFVYSDGERDRKTWIFTKTGKGRYVGTREDVIGTADVYEDGDAVRLSYIARVKTAKGDSYDVRFNDLLRLADSKRVINTANVTYFVVTVGQVDLDIRKK